MMKGQDLLDCFDFQNERTLDKQIYPKCPGDDEGIVCNGQWYLDFNAQSDPLQLMGQAITIHMLQKAGPQMAMHFQGAANRHVG